MLWRWVTAHQICFYASLTLAKISILSLYRRLLDRTPKKYTVIWWCILTFCLLVCHLHVWNLVVYADVLQSFVASSLSILLVCDDKKTQYKQGICRKPSEQDRVRFSLWLSYAVDVATDLAGIQFPHLNSLSMFMTHIDSHVPSVQINMESRFAQHAKAWHICAFR